MNNRVAPIRRSRVAASDPVSPLVTKRGRSRRMASGIKPVRQRVARVGRLGPAMVLGGAEADRRADRVADALLDSSGRSGVGTAKEGRGGGQVSGVNKPRSDVGDAVRAVGLRGTGQPLPRQWQHFFEPRLGLDLSGVRIHTDSHAQAAARRLGAQAFTMGRDVAFARDRWSPHSREGRSLLAHELAHVAQQSGQSGPARVDRRIDVHQAGQRPLGGSLSWGEHVQGFFQELCPGISWQLSGDSIVPGDAASCGAVSLAGVSTPESCQCVCSFTSAQGPHVRIEHEASSNDTVRESRNPDVYRIRLSGQQGLTIEGVFRGSNPPAGANSIQDIPDPPWLILGHELCGHAGRTYPAIGQNTGTERPHHESTRNWDRSAVDVENQIRMEHSALRGTDLGIRMGSFSDPQGAVHMGSRVALPRGMQLIQLMRTLHMPVGSFRGVCGRSDYFYMGCGGVAAGQDMTQVPLLSRVLYYMGHRRNLAYNCLWTTFPAGTEFGLEGIFWHHAMAGETKSTIAARWGVSVYWLNRANALFEPAVAALGDMDPLPAGLVLIIPYKWAPGATRYFLLGSMISNPQDC